MVKEFLPRQQPHDSQIARRLLFLLPFAPRLDATHGGGKVIAQLLTKLSVKNRVALLYLRGVDEPPIDETLRMQCEIVEEVARPQRNWSHAQRWLDRSPVLAALRNEKPIWALEWAVPAYQERLRILVQTWQPDIIQIEYPIMGQYLSALDRCLAPRVLVEYDPAIQAARDRRQLLRGLAKIKHYLDEFSWQRFERTVIREVQAVVVFTERDRQAVAALADQTPVILIPFGTELPRQSLNARGSSPPSLLFVGNFKHSPNVDAALRLINVIFPKVQAQEPQVLLFIVGEQPPAEISRMANERIIVTGWVPDVIPYLDRAALVVVPLRLGGGMRVKVLEALAAGKAVVASPLAIEGLDLRDEVQVAVAQSDDQFVERIMRLLNNPEERVAMASRARTWSHTNLGWGKSVAAYEALYQYLTEHSYATADY